MARRGHTPDQIVRELREVDRFFGEVADTAVVARHLEVSEATYHRWRNQYGGLKADDAKRLKHFEGEKRRVEEDRGRQGAGDRRSAGGRPGKLVPDRRSSIVPRNVTPPTEPHPQHPIRSSVDGWKVSPKGIPAAYTAVPTAWR